MELSNDPMSQLDYMGRRMGKTTAICEAAKNIGAVVVCHNAHEAARVAKEHGVKTRSMLMSFAGVQGPFLVDTTAVSFYASIRNREIEQLNSDAQELKKRLAARDAEVADLEHERDNANGRSAMLTKECSKINTRYAYERNDHGKTSFKLAKLEAEYAEEGETLRTYIEDHRRSIKSVAELVEALEKVSMCAGEKAFSQEGGGIYRTTTIAAAALKKFKAATDG